MSIKLVMSTNVKEFERVIKRFMQEQNIRIFEACYDEQTDRFEMFGCSMSRYKLEDCLIEVSDVDEDFYCGELEEINNK